MDEGGGDQCLQPLEGLGCPLRKREREQNYTTALLNASSQIRSITPFTHRVLVFDSEPFFNAVEQFL